MENIEKKHIKVSPNASIYIILVICSIFGSNYFGISTKSGIHISFFRIWLVIATLLIIIMNARKIRNSRYIMFYFFWFIWAIITVIWCKDFSLWIKSVFFIFLGVIAVFLALNSLKTLDDYVTVLKVYVVMMVVNDLIGLYESITGNYLFVQSEKMLEVLSYSKYVPIGITGRTTNEFGLFSVVGIFAALVLYKISTIQYEKFFLSVIIIITTALLIYSGSRGITIGLVLGIIMWIYYGTEYKVRRKTVLFFIAFGMICFVVYLFKYKVINQVILKFLSIDVSASINSSNSLRINMIKCGFYMILSTNGLGVGAGNSSFPQLYNYYVNNNYNLHNFWLQIFCEFGVLFGLIYLISYIKKISVFSKEGKISTNSIAVTISRFFYSLQFAFLFAFVSSSSIFSIEWIWVFWGVECSFAAFISGNLIMKQKEAI